VDRYLLFRTFDELDVGDSQITMGRTITETDIVNWCSLTGDWFYPHIDKVAAERSMFKQRVVPGILVYAVGTGLGVPADSTTIVANYGADDLRYTKPTWIADTIHLEIEVLEKDDRDKKSGVVTYRWDIVNQNGETVCASKLKILTAKQRRPYGE
jgi:3-hydroxybutyryl-CoA dehydratase